MSNETLFYVCGIDPRRLGGGGQLRRAESRRASPGKAFPLVVLWFAILVGGATTFAVQYSAEEQEATSAEFEKAGEEIEEEEGAGGFGNEGGAQGGETEESEEEAEQGKKGRARKNQAGPPKAQGKPVARAQKPRPRLTWRRSTALAFDKTELEAKPGKVTIDFTNPSAIPHNVVIEKDGEELAGSELIAEGKDSVCGEPRSRHLHLHLHRAGTRPGRHGRHRSPSSSPARLSRRVTSSRWPRSSTSPPSGAR